MLLFRTVFVALAALIVTFAMVGVSHAQASAPVASHGKPRLMPEDLRTNLAQAALGKASDELLAAQPVTP